jgi:molybdate transport system substrate-binding protein
VLAKVSLGEADAGIVYRTDVVAAPTGVAVVTIPAAYNVLAEYPIAVTTGAAQPTLARAWVALTVSAAGQDALHGRGFTTGASPAP